MQSAHAEGIEPYWEGEDIEALRELRPYVRWDVEDFLKRPPSRSDSAKVSEALRKLEKRGLITRDRGRGRGNTVRVRLTPSGVKAVVSISGYQNLEADGRPVELVGRL